MHQKRILFICKKRVDTYGISFGLLNSAFFVAEALEELGCITKVVTVVDSNDIDREVAHFKPNIAIIEAIWVPPYKLYEILPLHPKTRFVVRIHSKTPFLATEGIALDWIKQYGQATKDFHNFFIAPNNEELHDDIEHVLEIKNTFLPNIYKPSLCIPGHFTYWNMQADPGAFDSEHDFINIGCFGAIRALKNHLIQAFAAISFARGIKKKLRFHINSNRLEGKNANDVLKNLRALFAGLHDAELVEHTWMDHKRFIEVVKKMDLGMQVSLSESFNIVAADFVSSNVPIVVSKDIDWMPHEYRADPNSAEEIKEKLEFAWRGKAINLQQMNKDHLHTHNQKALHYWKEFVNG